MIILEVIPSRIIIESIKQIEIKLTIDDNQSNIFFKGKYLNLTVKKNGNPGIQTLYPLKYNNQPLIWMFTPTFDGTFTINATIQGEPNNIISTATLVVEPLIFVGKIDTSNNIHKFIANNNIAKAPVYKTEEEHFIDYNKGKVG